MRRRNKDRLTPAEEAVLRIQQGDSEAFFEVRHQYRFYLDNFRGIFLDTLMPRDFRRKALRRFALRFIVPGRPRAVNIVLYGRYLPEQPIVEQIFRWMRAATWLAELEDMMAEIDLCFLECCMEYVPSKSDWDLYLFVRFQKRFVDYVKQWATPVMPDTLDPLVIPYQENMEVDLYQPAEDVYTQLGAGWIWGTDCSPTFAALNPFERWLLVERYIEKRKIADIAKQAGMSAYEVRKRIKEAVMRLEESGRFWHTLSKLEAEGGGL